MTATRIPLFDLRLADEDVAAVEVVLRSGWLSMGPRTQAFEEAFAAHLGVRHALATSSCTAALHLAYLAAGVGPGDEVIVPAITFVATAAAVRYCGARPVLADVLGSHDLGVDPADVEGRITPRTKAVCAVHFAGYPVVTQPLRALCERHGLALIEDTAHAPHLPPVGLAGAFSFFANKVLSCGEGGLVATEDDEVAALVRSGNVGPPPRPRGRLRRHRAGLQLPPRRGAGRAAGLAPAAPGRRDRRTARAGAPLPRAAGRGGGRDGALPRRGGRAQRLLRHAHRGRRARLARATARGAQRAWRADQRAVPRRARVHSLR
jgi:hypothetical protein